MFSGKIVIRNIWETIVDTLYVYDLFIIFKNLETFLTFFLFSFDIFMKSMTKGFFCHSWVFIVHTLR